MADLSRLDDLLADRVLAALSPEDAAELDGLLARSGDPAADLRRADALEEALALAALAAANTGGSALGAGPSPTLMSRLQADAAAWARQQPAPLEAPATRFAAAPPSVPIVGGPVAPQAIAAPPRDRPRLVVVAAAIGWVAAAAAVFALVFVRTRPPEAQRIVTVTVPAPTPPAPRALTPAEERQALLSRGATVVRMDWSATKDPAAAGVTGDVVWNPSDNKGFMRFRGLAVNDRAQLQYQLWIFDKTRDQRHPIDGGVFDIDAATGDVIVPIQAKLPVREATLFAITIEKPGGVVVSSRERLVLAAKVPAGLTWLTPLPRWRERE